MRKWAHNKITKRKLLKTNEKRTLLAMNRDNFGETSSKGTYNRNKFGKIHTKQNNVCAGTRFSAFSNDAKKNENENRRREKRLDEKRFFFINRRTFMPISYIAALSRTHSKCTLLLLLKMRMYIECSA